MHETFLQRMFNEQFMGNRFLQFTGRISYGIYIYHALVRFLADPFLTKLIPQNSGVYYAVIVPLYTALTLGVAYLSFRFIETPINRQKRRFVIPRSTAGQFESLPAQEA